MGILQVHARDKRMAAGVEYGRIARATAGFTGAEIMNLMNQAGELTLGWRVNPPCSH